MSFSQTLPILLPSYTSIANSSIHHRHQLSVWLPQVCLTRLLLTSMVNSSDLTYTSIPNSSGVPRVWLTRLVSARLVTDLYSPSGGRSLATTWPTSWPMIGCTSNSALKVSALFLAKGTVPFLSLLEWIYISIFTVLGTSYIWQLWWLSTIPHRYVTTVFTYLRSSPLWTTTGK